MAMILYDLSDVAGRPISPYCIRVREVLNELGLSFTHQLLNLGEIAGHFNGRHATVPVLRDGDASISDSRAIVEYLAKHHDPRNKLFGDRQRLRLTNFIVDWVDATVMGQINRMTVLDAHNIIRPEDQPYFRRLEEKRLGTTLEQAHAERESYVSSFQVCLHPARRMIKEQRFLGGRQPSYADFTLHAAFHWARTVSDFQMLRDDDRLQAWIKAIDNRLDLD